jgi:hypothetical protein
MMLAPPMRAEEAADWALIDLESAVLWLRDVLPGVAFIDTTWPYHRLGYIAPGQTWTLMPPRPGPEQALFGRFRSTRRIPTEADPAALAARLQQGGATPVLFAGQTQAVRLLEEARRADLCLLVWVDRPQDMPALLSRAAMADLDALRLTDATGRMRQVLFLYPAAHAPSAALGMGASSLQIPDRASWGITIKPMDLLSDSSWPAEGDHSYSWLWIGPDVLTRLCLGAPPRDFQQIRVHFMPHTRHQKIATNLIFQLNGRPVAFDTSALGDTGGIVQIALPRALSKPLILGIGAFPDTPINPDDGRRLRACLVGVELTR